MYKLRTVFVVGAGASLELGFPTSTELKTQITQSLDLKFDMFNRLENGDTAVAQALKEHANYDSQKGADEYNKHLAAARHISSAMPMAISIDNFVDNQQDNRLTRMAKLGIASCLMDAENKCLNNYSIRQGTEYRINWKKFQNNWIHSFFQTLHEGMKKSEIEKIFENVNFIIFN